MDAVVFAAYGTAQEGAAARTIEPIAACVGGAVAPARCVSAFTSTAVMEVLAKQRRACVSLEDTLARLAREGCRHIAVQPGFFAEGWAMHDLRARVQAACGDTARVGQPLVACHADAVRLAEILGAEHPRRTNARVVLVAHGESWPADCPRPAGESAFDALDALRRALDARGRDDTILTTMATSDATVREIADSGVRAVTLAPLMIAAGHHAMRQVFGKRPDSLAARFAAAGIAVDPVVAGLGEYPAVRDLFADHARELCRV